MIVVRRYMTSKALANPAFDWSSVLDLKKCPIIPLFLHFLIIIMIILMISIILTNLLRRHVKRNRPEVDAAETIDTRNDKEDSRPLNVILYMKMINVMIIIINVDNDNFMMAMLMMIMCC